MLALANRLEDFNITVKDISVDWPGAVKRAQKIVDGCRSPKPENLKKAGVNLKYGEARFVDEHTIEVNGERIRAEKILIATGRRPPKLPLPGFEHTVTHLEALKWEKPPQYLAVIGGGIIGMEFAYIFRRLGSAVFVFEMLDYILYMLDGELRDAVTQHAKGLGINIYTAARVERIEKSANHLIVKAQKAGKSFEAKVDEVIVAAGQVPNIETLNLDAIGVTYDKGGILTDETLATSVPHIFAAGDVRKGAPQLSQIATEEGIIATKNAFLPQKQKIDESVIASFVGLTPKVASTGMTEEEARAAGYDVGIHRQDFAKVCPAANVHGMREGFVKIIFDRKTGRLLGGHIFGARAQEMVQQIAFMLKGKMTLQQAFMTPFVFPSISEVLWYALRPRPDDMASS